MKHIRAINRKAVRIEEFAQSVRATGDGGVTQGDDVVALESGAPQGPHIPLGCSLVFSP